MKNVYQLFKRHLSNTVPNSELTWKEFFQYRVSRKRFERVGGVISGAIGLLGGSFYFFAVADFDPTEQLFGLPDPTFAYVGGALGIGALSTAAGLLGMGSIWRLTKSK